MTAYLKWRGLSETALSLYRAAGALAGIASTLAFPAIQQRLGARPARCWPSIFTVVTTGTSCHATAPVLAVSMSPSYGVLHQCPVLRPAWSLAMPWTWAQCS